MTDSLLGEIRAVGFNFAPIGWAFCNGQLLLIADNDALYSLLGTTYGGDGITTFNLPNLNSRLAVGSQGGAAGPGLSAYPLGAQLGTEVVTLTVNQMPAHSHPVAVPLQAATAGATATVPVGKFPATSSNGNSYAASATPGATLNAGAATAALGIAGGNQPHSNVQPVQALNYIIATQGIYPSRN